MGTSMSDTDARLERAINLSLRALTASRSREAKALAWEQLRMLINRRSAGQVALMERERRLVLSHPVIELGSRGESRLKPLLKAFAARSLSGALTRDRPQ